MANVGRPANSNDIWKSSVGQIPMGDTNEKKKDIRDRINKRFRVYDRLINSTIQGARGVIASGAAGCGKTHTMETKIAEWNVPPNDFKIHSGELSPVELYKSLYRLRGRNQIFGADDCDSIFHNETTLNLLKAAGDLKRSKRIISWGKNSWALLASKNDGEEIPREFEYYGSCMFGTNLDLQAMINANGRLSRHYAALLDRFQYLDLGVHTKREIYVRIFDVMSTTNFLEMNELVPYGQEILNFIEENLARIQRPSIRIALKLGQLMKDDEGLDEDHKTWRETAEVTLFNIK